MASCCEVLGHCLTCCFCNTDSNFDYAENLLNDTTLKSHIVPRTEEKGFTPIYRNIKYPDGLNIPAEMEIFWNICEIAFRKHADLNCLGFRTHETDGSRGEFLAINYETVKQAVENIASGLCQLGARHQDAIGIYSKNRPEWFQIYLTNARQGFKTTALYDTLGPEVVAYILQDAEIKIAFCDIDNLENLLASTKSEKHKTMLETIIVFDYQPIFVNEPDQLTNEQKEMGDRYDVQIIGMSDLISMGSKYSEKPGNVQPLDVLILMYTSGTTGVPKGVQLSNKGMCHALHGAKNLIALNENDRHMSFLPLSHVFEMFTESKNFTEACACYYYQGDIRKLTEDWKSVQPTILVGVPRVYSKVYDKVMAKVAAQSGIKQAIFRNAFNISAAKTRTGDRNSILDSVVWKNVGAEAGLGKVRLMISGAAPLPPYVAEFFRIIVMNGSVLEGYGLTECTGAGFVTTGSNLNLGHVGTPCPGIDMKLQDIPNMNYLTTDVNPRGEILLRGPQITLGYHKKPDKTKEVIVDGWFHTGDVGRMNPDGTLSIIDRKKNLFKTCFGEYIAVEKVEGVYQKCSAVNQIWIYGNSYKSFIVAVVVPDAIWVKSELMKIRLWRQYGIEEIEPGTTEFSEKFANVCVKNMDVVKKIVLASMKKHEKELLRFERIKDIILEVELDTLLQGFSVQNNLMTPSFKSKRPMLLKRYVTDLKTLYTSNGEAPKADEHWIQ